MQLKKVKKKNRKSRNRWLWQR